MSNGMRGLRRVLIAAACCFAVALLSSDVRAQNFSVTNLTNNPAGTKASFPSMAVDPSGNTYLVWAESTQGIVVFSNFDGTKFNTQVPVQTSAPVLPAFQPQIALYLNSGGPTRVEIVWASLHPGSTPATYDVYASRSDDAGAIFTAPILVSATTGPVPLADTPRVAFDMGGQVNVVWGQTGVWISQAQDGKTFGAAIPLVPPTNPPPDTGGPRIAVSAANHIFVVWTDEANKNAQGSFCTLPSNAPTPYTNTVGGNFWINETLPGGTPAPSSPSSLTRNLSNKDWLNGGSTHDARFPMGFFGCSYDNLKLFTDPVGGLVHLVWSDDTPDEDVLTSESHGTFLQGNQFAGFTQFSFPINLASHLAASPNIAADQGGNFYLVWSGGPGPGAPPDSEGIFFRRYDAATDKFSSEINVAQSGSLAQSAPVPSAFPQIAVDSSSNVNIAWEQPTAALKGDGTDVFNLFFARSTDQGNTFPTVMQVSTNPSVLCFEAPPPPQGTGALPTTPDVSTCGTAQIGIGPNSSPGVAWVNQANATAAADIDFATASFPSGSVSPSSASLSASNKSANFTVTLKGFSGSVNLSCQDADTNAALPAWLTCTFAQNPLNASQSNTDTLTITRAGTPTSSMLLAPRTPSTPPYSGPAALRVLFTTLLLIAVVALFIVRRQQTTLAGFARGLAIMTLTVVLAAALVSCGGTTSTSSSTGTTGTSGSSGGGGGTGGTGGSGNAVTVHVSVLAQSGSGSAADLGTVTITAQ